MASKGGRVYVDANILLDIVGKRPRLLRVLEIIRDKNVATSSVNVATAYYFARKDGIDNLGFREYTDLLEIVPVDEDTIDLAYDLAVMNDLEDALQVAACKQAGIDILVTADKGLAELYCDELNIEFVE